MPKLTLQFGDHVLKEVPIGPHGVKIGRLPDNALMIDNPAVSSHHARVFLDGDKVVAEDLGSTNGTFINDTRITRQALEHGDELIVGKHKIVFDKFSGDAPAAAADQPDEAMPDLEGGTVYLDTKKQRELLAKMGIQAPTGGRTPGHAPGHAASHAASSPTAKVVLPSPTMHAAPARVGVLRVLAGTSDKQEYTLDAHTALIGKSDTAAIRLKGWFKPKVAVSISRKGESYVATPLGGKPTVNSQPLTGRHDLKEGDVIQVSGLTLEFRLK